MDLLQFFSIIMKKGKLKWKPTYIKLLFYTNFLI